MARSSIAFVMTILAAAACGSSGDVTSVRSDLQQCATGGSTYGSGCGSSRADGGIDAHGDGGFLDDASVDAGIDAGTDGGNGSADAGVAPGGDAGTGNPDGGTGGGDAGGGSGDGGVGGSDGGVGASDAGVTDAGGGSDDDAGVDGGGGSDGGAGSDGGIGGGSCGDGSCSSGEGCDSCPADCGACPTCGDGTCNGSETCTTCPDDCGACGCSGEAPEECKNVLQVFEETYDERPDPSCTEVAEWLVADDWDPGRVSTYEYTLESAQYDAVSVDPYEIRARLFDGSLVGFTMVSLENGQTMCSFVATWDEPIKEHWVVESPPITPDDNSPYAEDICDNGWQDDPFDCWWEEQFLLDQAGGVPPQDTSDNTADPDYIIEVDP
jgi:hypothetical protein